jgi:hypothetical protein
VSGFAAIMTPRMESFLLAASTFILILRHLSYDLRLSALRLTTFALSVAGSVKGSVNPSGEVVSTFVPRIISLPSVSLRMLIVALVDPELKNSTS